MKAFNVDEVTMTSYNHFHNIFRLFDVLPNFPYITYKDGINELPHDLPHDLRLRILGN